MECGTGTVPGLIAAGHGAWPGMHARPPQDAACERGRARVRRRAEGAGRVRAWGGALPFPNAPTPTNRLGVHTQVLRIVRERGLTSVCGNHDDQALAAWRAWAAGGAIPKPHKHGWVQGLEERYAQVLQGLPFTVSLPAYAAVLVHAGLLPGQPLAAQSDYDMFTVGCRDGLGVGSGVDAAGVMLARSCVCVKRAGGSGAGGARLTCRTLPVCTRAGPSAALACQSGLGTGRQLQTPRRRRHTPTNRCATW